MGAGNLPTLDFSLILRKIYLYNQPFIVGIDDETSRESPAGSWKPRSRIRSDQKDSAYQTPTAHLRVFERKRALMNEDKRYHDSSTPVTPTATGFYIRVGADFQEITPSEGPDDDLLPDSKQLISRARQIDSKLSLGADPVLELWAEATSVSVLTGSHSVPPSVWTYISNAATTSAHTMTISQISEFLRLMATALHRCGRRLNPPSDLFTALADSAKTMLRSRSHSGEELLELQLALADILRVISLGGGAGNRTVERQLWGEGIATKLLPLVGVGMAALYNTYKRTAVEMEMILYNLEDTDGDRAKKSVIASALFFIEALAPMACLSSSVASQVDGILINPFGNRNINYKRNKSSSETMFASLFSRLVRNKTKKTKSKSTVSGGQHVVGTTTAISTNGGSSTGCNYPMILSKITSRALAVSEWLEVFLTPSACRCMNFSELDRFASALVVALGDDSTKDCDDIQTVSPVHECLIRCAIIAFKEVTTRIEQLGGAGNIVTPLNIKRARRLAATAKRIWEVAACMQSPWKESMLKFVDVLEQYVACKEEQEDEAVRAEIAAASAAHHLTLH